MSLGIVFKGAEGIVLAADSRVTLTSVVPAPGGTPVAIPSTYDNATKLLKIPGQQYVGAVTYGLGALGAKDPRTAHSFLPEFEAELNLEAEPATNEPRRLGVEQFANKLSGFFLKQWKNQNMPEPEQVPPGMDMAFLVGGYDEKQPYGRVFELHIPTNPTPREWHTTEFGMVWGGQREFTDRLISGFDANLLGFLKEKLNLDDAATSALAKELQSKTQAPIPFQFLPLQDCVDLVITLIRTTISVQSFLVGVRGVGGAIDVATITRTDGLSEIQYKKIAGEIGRLGRR